MAHVKLAFCNSNHFPSIAYFSLIHIFVMFATEAYQEILKYSMLQKDYWIINSFSILAMIISNNNQCLMAITFYFL